MSKVDSDKLHEYIDKQISDNSSDRFSIPSDLGNSVDASHVAKIYNQSKSPDISDEKRIRMHREAFNYGLHSADMANDYIDMVNSGVNDFHATALHRAVGTKGVDKDKAADVIASKLDHFAEVPYVDMPVGEIKDFTSKLSGRVPDHAISNIIEESLSNTETQNSKEDLDSHFDFLKEKLAPFQLSRFYGKQENTPPHILTHIADTLRESGEVDGYRHLFSHKNIPQNYINQALKSDKSDGAYAFSTAKIPDEILDNVIRKNNRFAIENLSENENLTKEQELKLAQAGHFIKTDENSKLSSDDRLTVFNSLPDEKKRQIAKDNWREPIFHDYMATHGDEDLKYKATRSNKPEILNRLLGEGGHIGLTAAASQYLPSSLLADHIKSGAMSTEDIESVLRDRNHDPEWINAAAENLLSKPNVSRYTTRQLIRSGSISKDIATKLYDKNHYDDPANFLDNDHLADHIAINHTSELLNALEDGHAKVRDIADANFSKKGADKLLTASPDNKALIDGILMNGNIKPSHKMEILSKLTEEQRSGVHFGYASDRLDSALNKMPPDQRNEHIQDIIDTIKKHGNGAAGLTWDDLSHLDLSDDQAREVRGNIPDWHEEYHSSRKRSRLNDEEIQKVLSSESPYNNRHLKGNLKDLGLVDSEDDENLNAAGKQHLLMAVDQKLSDGNVEGASKVLGRHIRNFDSIINDPEIRSKMVDVSKKSLEFGSSPNQMSNMVHAMFNQADNVKDGAKLFNDIVGQHEYPHDVAHHLISAQGGNIGSHSHHLFNDLLNSAPEGHPIVKNLVDSGVKIPFDVAMKHSAHDPNLLSHMLQKESDPDKIRGLTGNAIHLHNSGEISTKDLSDMFRSKSLKLHSSEQMQPLVESIISNLKDPKAASSLLNSILNGRKKLPDFNEAEVLHATSKFAEKHPAKVSYAAKILSSIGSQASNKAISNLISSSVDAGHISEASKMIDMLDEHGVDQETQSKIASYVGSVLSGKPTKTQVKKSVEIASKLQDPESWSKAMSKIHETGKADPESLMNAIGEFKGSFNSKAFSVSLDIANEKGGEASSIARYHTTRRLLSSDMAANVSPKQLSQLSNIFKTNDAGGIQKDINPSLAVQLIPDAHTFSQVLSVAHSGYTKMSPAQIAGLSDKAIEDADNLVHASYSLLEPFLKQDPKNLTEDGGSSERLASAIVGRDISIVNGMFSGKTPPSGTMDLIASKFFDKTDHQDFLSSRADSVLEYLSQNQNDLNKKSASKFFDYFARNMNEEGVKRLVKMTLNASTLQKFDIPNADDVFSAAITKASDDNDLHVHLSSIFKLGAKTHESISRMPGGIFLLAEQDIHPDNFPSVDRSLGIDENDTYDNMSVFRALDHIVSRIPAHQRSLVGDKYVDWLNEALSSPRVNDSSFSDRVDLDSISRYLSDDHIQKINSPRLIKEIVANGGGSESFQASLFNKDEDFGIGYANKLKSSPLLSEFIDKNWSNLSSNVLIDCLKQGKVLSNTVDDIALDSHDKNVAKELLSSSNITESQFDSMEGRFPVSKDNKNGIFEVKAGWSPIFDNPQFGLKKFLDITASLPKTITKLGVNPASAIQSVNVSSTHKDILSLASLIPPTGISWQEFKKANPAMASSHHIQKTFVNAPKQFLTPDILNKAIADGADSYKVTYGTWSGIQRHQDSTPNMVVQVNANQKLQEALSKDPMLKMVYQYVNTWAQRSGHPSTPYMVGWARVDVSDPQNWLIEETQSDFAAGLRSQLDQLKKEGHDSLEVNGQRLPLSVFGDYAKKIQTLTSNWLDAIHSAVHDMAKKQGIKNLYMHGADTRAQLSGMDPKRYPEWLNHMYTKYPPQNGWSTASYSSLSNRNSSFEKEVKNRPFGYNSLNIWKKPVT